MIKRIQWTLGIGLFLGLLAWSINGITAWLKLGHYILPITGFH